MQCDHCAYRFFMKDAYGHIQGLPWCGKTQKPLETAGAQVEPWCPLSQWRSLRHDPLCHQHERVWVAGPRLPVLPKFICLEINPRPAEYWRGLGFTHWMPIEDWPLPPAPEGAA